MHRFILFQLHRASIMWAEYDELYYVAQIDCNNNEYLFELLLLALKRIITGSFHFLRPFKYILKYR